MADSRINLYDGLSTMLAAGVPITRAMQTIHKRGKYGRIFADIEQQIAEGNSLADAVDQRARQFQKLDITLIRAGEETGQLAEMLAELSRWYAFRQRMNRMIIAGLVYPALMIHALAFLAPAVPFALGGFHTADFIRGFVTIIAMFYIPAAVIVGLKLFTPERGYLRAFLDMFIMKLPLIGKAVRELDLSRYAKVFSVTYAAGLPIVRCSEIAAEAVSNRVMYARLAGATQKARAGQELSLGFSKHLPPAFVNLWQVGEESGQLDDATSRLANMHADNAERRLAAIAEWAPRLVYAVVAGVMVYYIITGFLQIYGNILP